ncbi:TPA: hypothetical protein N0F65_010985 [Lagenidium giganteum]|uniref:Transposase n=1 Tax=Lagenidium giganteum TaxID=4803 RepID=A0AAV2Z6B1_9STRA|nr:TPA: hypothetical protein N0F65_010985 [Lagenidium giganteum]
MHLGGNPRHYIYVFHSFYLDERQQAVQSKFPALGNTSTVTIYRLLRFDLNLTRKVLTKRASEAVPADIRVFVAKLGRFKAALTKWCSWMRPRSMAETLYVAAHGPNVAFQL